MAQQIKKKFLDPNLVGKVDLLEQDLSQEISDRQQGDSALGQQISDLAGVVQGNADQLSDLDAVVLSHSDQLLDHEGRIEALESVEEIKEVVEVESLSDLDLLDSPIEEVVYVTKDTNKIYRLVEGQFEPIVLPQTPATPELVVTTSITDQDDLQATINAANDGDVIFLANGTYTYAGLSIAKQIALVGESQAGVLLQDSRANSQTFMNISVDNVILKDLTIRHATTDSSIGIAIAASGGGFPQVRLNNFKMYNVKSQYSKGGLAVRSDNFVVEGCTFEVVAGSSTRRGILHYGNGGDSFIKNNHFINATTGALRAICPTSTSGSNPSDDQAGSLTIEGSSFTGNLSQFVNMDNHQGQPGAFELIVKDNVTPETNAFVVSNGGVANFGDLFSRVILIGNNLTNSHNLGLGKGVFGIDADSLASFRSSSLPIIAIGNVLGQTLFRSGWAEASGSMDGIAGYNTVTIAPQPVVEVSDELGIQLPNSFAELSATDLSPIEAALGELEDRLSTVEDDIASLEELQDDYLKLDGSRAMQADLNMFDGSTHHIITGLSSPLSARDAANKEYVDSVAEGLAVKPHVKAATTANLVATYDNGVSGVGATLNLGPLAVLNIDGVTEWFQYAGILVKNQTNTFENGRYFISQVGSDSVDWILTRCGFCDTAQEIPSAYVFVQEGSTQSGTGWVALVGTSLGSDPSQFEVGFDAITWVQFSGAGAYTAGAALSLDGGEFSVNFDNTTISLNAGNELQVSTSVMQRIDDAESAISSLETDLTAEIQDRIDGDAATLDAAKDHADDKAAEALADAKAYADALVSDSQTLFSNGSLVVGSELSFIDLDKEYTKLMSVAVARAAVHEGEDYTVSVVDGKTRLTWINSLANPDGEEKIETGDKVFWVGAYLPGPGGNGGGGDNEQVIMTRDFSEPSSPDFSSEEFVGGNISDGTLNLNGGNEGSTYYFFSPNLSKIDPNKQYKIRLTFAPGFVPTSSHGFKVPSSGQPTTVIGSQDISNGYVDIPAGVIDGFTSIFPSNVTNPSEIISSSFSKMEIIEINTEGN